MAPRRILTNTPKPVHTSLFTIMDKNEFSLRFSTVRGNPVISLRNISKAPTVYLRVSSEQLLSNNDLTPIISIYLHNIPESNISASDKLDIIPDKINKLPVNGKLLLRNVDSGYELLFSFKQSVVQSTPKRNTMMFESFINNKRILLRLEIPI